MRDDYISSPRPMFEDEPADLKRGVHRLKMGSTSAGIVLDVTKKGITVNGYYRSFSNAESVFACVREPVEITWEELEKVRLAASKRKRKAKAGKKTIEPTAIDTPSKKYLESLPVVTINSKKYYLDTELRQRRPVDNPSKMFNY
jgi:hypothetical protein